MNRRQFEKSEVWQLVVEEIDRRIGLLMDTLIAEDSQTEMFRAQGSIVTLNDLKTDFPNLFPDEFIDGKPVKDVVREIINGSGNS